MRVESARADAEASFARDQLSSRMRETENQVSSRIQSARCFLSIMNYCELLF